MFVKHPYDVGDRVDVVGTSGEKLIVERISLLYTVFVRIDKMQTVQVPNIILNNLWIENVTRSKAMKEVIEINVSFDTSFEDIELLRQEMEKFVRSPDNSRDFLPDIIISVGGVGDLDKLQLRVVIKHKSNWHNEAVRATRRSKFMCALTLALKRIPINAPGGGGEALGGPTNPSYSVAVSDEIAAASRDKAEKDKQAARMIPPKPAEETDTLKDELRAVQGFTTVNPTVLADDWGYTREDNKSHDTRGASVDQRRSNDIESQRLSLQKSPSVAGRRRAGDAPARPIGENYDPRPVGSENMPGLQVTQHLGPFDEEAQIGGPNPFQSDGHSQNTSTQSGSSSSPYVPGTQAPPRHPSRARAPSSSSRSNYEQR